MRNRSLMSIAALVTVLVFAPIHLVHAQNAPPPSAGKQPFDPRDLTGVWGGDPGPGNSRWDNKTPEPPLTDWAKQHLLYKSISHDAMAGKLKDPTNPPKQNVSDGLKAFYATDLYGVVANDPNGEYPGKDCEPLSSPAVFEYPGLGSMEILPTRGGDRIFQLFEYHREWRTFWLNRDHPKDLDPTYEGDSTAHWEGDTLVVDTIGYNGKTMITGLVGHSKSDAFHLVERYRRVDHDHLQIDMTYYDPKAWGDKSWSGFHKYYHLVPKDDFQEFICSPREYKEYDSRMTDKGNDAAVK